MTSWRAWWSGCLIVAISGAGCAHLVETRTIEKFAENLEKEDLKGLKSTTSSEFASRALRTADSLDDLKILRIPDGKVSVVEVEELSGDQRRVTVRMGEAKKEVFYELTRNNSGSWVVDDIYLKQKKQGVEAYKAVSEQMDLLLTVREFFDACDDGERNDVLKGTTPRLRGALEKLPPTYLARLTGMIVAGRDTSKSQRPQAQLSENTAVVKLPRKTGELLLTLELDGDRWQVDDVLIESKTEDQRLPSLFREAVAVEQCLDFLAAYERNDRKAVEETCDANFYEGSLSLGNFKEVRLPSSLLTDHELKSSLTGLRADFTLKSDREIVVVTLHRNAEDDLVDRPEYRVTNVSIFDLATHEEMRLGAMFTARAMAEYYLQSLAQLDVAQLRHGSTRDFSSRVWQKLNGETVKTLPLEPFLGTPAALGKVHFDGPLVRVAAVAGDHGVELVLREETGKFLVDDIRWELPGRPTTAKETLELMIPVRNFAYAISLARSAAEQENALALLQQSSSRDFNRMVWTQTEYVPNSGLSADSFLNAPLKSLTQTDGQVIVQLGDQRFGAVVTMIKEQNAYAIDEVQLIAGPQPTDRVTLKKELRTLLARGLAQPPEGVQHASAKLPPGPLKSRVVHADFENDPEFESDSPSGIPQELTEPDDAMPIELWDEAGAVQTEPEVQ